MANLVPPRPRGWTAARERAIRAEVDSTYDGRIAKARGVKRCALKTMKQAAMALRLAGEPNGLAHGKVLYGRTALKK